ncbi:DUF305 domain-containing protein [Cupriavidus basilensis]|uniref:DUF305 domain-containing protein n=1 Tax=Cupriavidus basilensis TaxID=68895 RepID=UPI00075126D2
MAILHASPRRLARAGAGLMLALALCASAGTATATATGGSDEEKFMAENDAAMTKMMDGMAVKPSGDIDADFAAMMIPHHQGAIDMAMSELRYGHNEQLRRIAQEIIVDQLQEIAAMRLALGQPLPPSEPAPTQAGPGQPATPTAPADPATHNHAMHAH